jgi:hypothetical protein
MVDVLCVADGHKRICSTTDELLHQVGCLWHITVMACVWTRVCRVPGDDRPLLPSTRSLTRSGS